jgi:hypothetical protein
MFSKLSHTQSITLSTSFRRPINLHIRETDKRAFKREGRAEEQNEAVSERAGVGSELHGSSFDEIELDDNSYES